MAMMSVDYACGGAWRERMTVRVCGYVSVAPINQHDICSPAAGVMTTAVVVIVTSHQSSIRLMPAEHGMATVHAVVETGQSQNTYRPRKAQTHLRRFLWTR